MKALCGDNVGWVEQLVDLCQHQFVGPDGLLVTALGTDGQVLDATPLIADFGDVLPFLDRFGARDFVTGQIALARPWLTRGLFKQGGCVRLFDNHDWLLGLLDLYETTGDGEFLALARNGATTIANTMFVGDLLVDSTMIARDPRTWLRPASPYGGGFIELWMDLYEMTGDRIFFDASVRLAGRWERTPEFDQTGVFHRVLCSYSNTLNRAAKFGAKLGARLFKDNTNFIWSLIALHRVSGDQRWAMMVARWCAGFRQQFLNSGDVYLWLDRAGRGRVVSLKAAHSAIDLLCDIAAADLDANALETAEIIARRWYGHRWTNGLFPENPGVDRDHLDANVDMAIALSKLAAATGRDGHAERARTTAAAVVANHLTSAGLVQAIDSSGSVCDARVIVKYQSLALKLALAPSSPVDLVNDPVLLKLLRDR